MSTDVDNFLAHYGVKGMRWGVRKKGESTPADLARRKDITKKVAIGVAAVAALGIAVYAGKQAHNYNLTNDKILKGERFAKRIMKRYSDKDGKVFDVGTGFLRRSTMPETGMSGHRTFAVLEGVKNTSKHDQVKFGHNIIRIKSIDRMIAPSTKARVDLLAKSVPLAQDDALFGRIAEQRATAKSLGAKLAVRNFTGDKKLGSVQLSRITASEWKSEAAKQFIKNLKENGFSAVWDDWDEGTAHILFDDSKIKYMTKF